MLTNKLLFAIFSFVLFDGAIDKVDAQQKKSEKQFQKQWKRKDFQVALALGTASILCGTNVP